MAKPPIKLSGLIKTGAVVPASPTRELADFPDPPANNGDPHPVAQTTIANSGRALTMIGVHLIDPNPLAPREVYTPEMILNRAEDLRSQGQHDPIHVIPNPSEPGRFIICDGWTRVQACREHKVFDALLAEVHTELGLQESAWFGYEQNEGRSQHCDLDRAMFYEKLLAAGESQAEIARRAKLSKTMMSFYRAYSRLPEDVMDIIRMRPDKFGATVAYQLFKLNEKVGIKKTVALAAKYAEEDHSWRWMANQCQTLMNALPRNSKTQGKTVRFVNGVYKQRGDSFELTITVPAEQRETFARDLEKLLETAAIAVTPPEDAPNTAVSEETAVTDRGA